MKKSQRLVTLLMCCFAAFLIVDLGLSAPEAKPNAVFVAPPVVLAGLALWFGRENGLAPRERDRGDRSHRL